MFSCISYICFPCQSEHDANMTAGIKKHGSLKTVFRHRFLFIITLVAVLVDKHAVQNGMNAQKGAGQGTQYGAPDQENRPKHRKEVGTR